MAFADNRIPKSLLTDLCFGVTISLQTKKFQKKEGAKPPMKSAVLIKSLKKFKKFNSSVEFNNILLTGYNPLNTIDKKINSHNLVKKTCTLGKKIYKIIKEIELDKNGNVDLLFEIVNPEDNISNKEIIQKHIKNFKNIKSKNHTHYNLIFNFYKKCYELLKQSNISEGISVDMLPLVISNNIGLATKNYYEGYEFDLKILKKLKEQYDNFFTIVENNLDKIDLESLIKEIKYIPINIENFYENIYINGDGINNKYAIEIFNAITEWCMEFGMPFWTERTELSKYTKDLFISNGEIYDKWINESDINSPNGTDSSYTWQELANNSVPINGLITISIIMYLFYSIWEEYHSIKKLSKEKEEELVFLKSIIGSDSDDPIDLLEKADVYHNYILNNFNCIRALKLNINEKKVKTTQNGYYIFYNVKQYESSAIAAWDVFYHDYLGNSEINNPLPYCNICQKEISKNEHYIKTGDCLCNSCYKKREKVLGKNRTNKFRKNNN